MFVQADIRAIRLFRFSLLLFLVAGTIQSYIYQLFVCHMHLLRYENINDFGFQAECEFSADQ